jgi:hypothetical protein
LNPATGSRIARGEKKKGCNAAIDICYLETRVNGQLGPLDLSMRR